MPRIAPPPSASTLRQRRSSRSSDTRRLSGVRAQARRLSAEWLALDPRTAIDPHSSWLKVWRQVLLLALVYEYALLPYAVAFLPSVDTENNSLSQWPPVLSHAGFQIFYACEALFLADFYVQLNTGFYEDGNVLRDASRSRIKYLKSAAFVLDAAAIVPLALIVKPTTLAVPAWLEFHKWLRLWRVPEYYAALEDLYANFFVTLKMLKVFIVTALVTHTLTCARVSFGYRSAGDDDHRWLPDTEERAAVSSSPYMRGFFWTFGLLTGVYEAELPRAPAETVFTAVVLLIGFSLFAYLCAMFFVLSKGESTTQSIVAQARMSQLKHILCYYHVPDHLQAQAVEYIKRYYTDVESNDREVLKLLCPSIASDIQIELLRDTVAKIPLFKGCSMQFIVALTSLLELVSLPADFTLFSAGDQGDCMYVVNSGVLHIIVGGAKVRELHIGSFFGEVSVFSKRPRSATVMTASYCTLYKLSRFHIERVLEGYPQYAEVIARAVETILSHRPGTAGYSAIASPGTSAEEYLLSTLFHISDANEDAQGPPPAAFPSRSNDPRRRTLRHTRSTGPPIAVAMKPVEEAPRLPIPTVKEAKPKTPKRPAIGRSKSTQNVSIARREQLSMISRRSEREKTEAGNSEAPDDFMAATAKNNEAVASKIDDDTRAPSHVPRAAPLKRSQTFNVAGKTTQQHSRSVFRNDRTATAVDALQNFYDNLSRMLAQKREQQYTRHMAWLSKLLLRKPILLQSRFRRVWVGAQLVVIVYNWVCIPMELGFVALRDETTSAWYMQLLNTVADLLLWADMYVSANLEVALPRDSSQRHGTDPVHAAMKYFRSRLFLTDTLSALPYWMIVPPAWKSPTLAWILRSPRLARVWRLHMYAHEVGVSHEQSQSSSPTRASRDELQPNRAVRGVTMGIAVFLVFHVVACSYFGLTQWEGFAEPTNVTLTSWLPPAALDPSDPRSRSNPSIVAHQYASALFFATTTLTTLGHTYEPATNVQFVFAIAYMGIGLLLSAMLVDVVHTRFTAASFEQREFFITRARIESFLRSQSAPTPILQRVNAFLDFWWSSHRGAIVNDVLQELPETIRRDIIHAMCQPAIQTLALLPDVRPVLSDFERVFVDSVDFILYGQGEIIYRQGDYASGLFFLLDGEVCMITDGAMPRTIPKGGFFGTASLHLSESSVSYAERMTAISGCILLFVSRQHLQTMHKTFPTLSMALKSLEKRIIDSKFARAHSLESRRASISVSLAEHARLMEANVKRFPRFYKWLSDTFGLDPQNPVLLFDPDASSTTEWQVFISFIIVLQSFKIIYEMCFGVEQVVLSEACTTLCELCFIADMLFCSRLGFVEYGNKIMDITHMQRRYFHSPVFKIDAIALVPLFMLNWVLGSVGTRVELLNAHKLLRLLRVTSLLKTMEVQHLNRTLELRLLKIVYYTMLLAHTLGSIWFSFGYSTHENEPWLPDRRLQQASAMLQYWTAVFWSFGAMTASSTANTPETSAQALFSSLTMLVGLGLFAYIVGNVTDVVELRGADTREFNAQLTSLRMLLRHFALPEHLQNELKTFVFFQRFHSITQEHILEDCLPPSLLTDIRLVHLQPMMVKVAFLGNMEASITRMLVSQFLQELVVKDHFVCRYGDEGSDMYFVFTGIIEVLVPAATLHRLGSDTASTGGSIAAAAATSSAASPSDQPPQAATSTAAPSHSVTMKKVNELTAGSYFGEIALFSNKPRTANVRARTSIVLYKLSRRSLELVFERYPEWKKRVLKIVQIQQEQQHLRNLYMAEQQHDENRIRKEQLRARASGSDVSQPKPLVHRLGDKLAEGSKRMVRQLSKKHKSDTLLASPPPSPHVSATSPRRHAPTAAQVAPAAANAQAPTPPSPPSAQGVMASGPGASSVGAKMAVAKAAPTSAVPELWIDKLLTCTEVQSPSHVMWLRVMAVATLFMAVAVPYRIAFDTQFYEDASGRQIALVLPMVTRILEHVCEVLFAWDIWMNWNLKESVSSMELYETKHRTAYEKQHRLLWDTLSAFPIDHFVSDFYASPWLRLNRCIKLLNFQHYVDEIYRRSVRYEHTRFVSRWLLFLVAIYWCASAYFYVARATTAPPLASDWYQWAPPSELLVDNDSPTQQLALRFLRSFFFSVTIFVKKGKTFPPETEPQVLFTLVVSFVGLLTMAVMIGEIANMYVSYISNEVEFRHHHLAVKTYLNRLHVGVKLRRRVQAFLASLWSLHRGVKYQAILNDLPLELRNDVVLHVASEPLQNYVSMYFNSLFPNASAPRSEMEALVSAIVPHLKYEGYPRDENVIAEGSVAKAMYFVVKGLLISRSSAESVVTAALAAGPNGASAMCGEQFLGLTREARLVKGDFFGERGLLGYAVSRVTVRTVRACDLFALSSESLLEVLLSRPLLHAALAIAVESYKDMTQLLQQKCGQLDADALDAAALLGMTSADEPWGDVILAVVRKRQQQWQDEWRAGEIAAPLHALLAPIRELSHPEASRRTFDNMLRLLLPHGSLYARLASVRNRMLHRPDEDEAGAMFTNASDFQDNLPVMMSATSLHSERIGFSMLSTLSSSGSRDMSSQRRPASRSRVNTQSLAAKMLPPSK